MPHLPCGVEDRGWRHNYQDVVRGMFSGEQVRRRLERGVLRGRQTVQHVWESRMFDLRPRVSDERWRRRWEDAGPVLAVHRG